MTVSIRIHTPGYGFGWFRRGWRAFMRTPGLLIGVLLLWLAIAFGLQLLPLIGSLLFVLVAPALYAGYLLLGRAAAHEREPVFEQFFSGLTRADCRMDMLWLGVFLFVAQVLLFLICGFVMAALALPLIGTIPLNQIENAPELLFTNVRLLLIFGVTALVALILYAILAMAFTYAAPLVLDGRAAPLPALKASLRGCLMNILPLAVFGLIYIALFLIAIIPLGLGLLVLIPVSMAALAVSYEDIFSETDGE